MLATETTGWDLRVERVRARLRAEDVARAAGVTRARISAVEAQAFVTATWAARYRHAITVALEGKAA